MPFLYSLLIVAMDVARVFALMSTKCVVVGEPGPYPGFSIPTVNYCPGPQLRAVCRNVSDLALDLPTVPQDIKVLCVWVGHGSTLQVNALVKFHSLGSLYIYGCLSTIHSEAFRSLTNLHLLSMTCKERCNSLVPSKLFHDLYNLEELKLENYTLSEMAADVFDGLSRVKRFDVKGNYSFSELLCKLSYFSASLEYLSIEMDVETLTTANCSYDPIQFPSLRNVMFSFPHVKRIERNAFKHIVKVTLLSMPMSDVLHAQLIHSGIQQIQEMDLYLTEMNIQSICEVALALSVTSINLHFNTLQKYSESSWEKCYKLEEMTLTGEKLTRIDLSFMPTLKNVKHFDIAFLGKPSTEDKSLVSLCKNNVSLSSLKHFSYNSEQNLSLKTSQFVCLNHVEILYLAGSNIKIEDFAFQGLHHLQHLFLRNWKTQLLISQSAFKGLSGLHSLAIYAFWYILKPEVFSDLLKVKELHLSDCRIQLIEDFAFTNLSEVRHIDLTRNNISKLTKNTFNGLQSLESLMLENNPLMHLEAECFAHLPSLRVLHLGNLMLPNTELFGMQVLNLSLIFGGFPRNLSDLTITSVVRPMTLVIADNSTPDVNLSLALSGQKIVLWGCRRPFIQSVTKLHVVTDFFVCAPHHTVAFCHFTSVVFLGFSQVHSSTIQSLSCLNRLVNLKSLTIERVNFINDPGVSHMFHNLTQLESLHLTQCWVDSLEDELSLDLTSLKYFFIALIGTEVSLTTGFFEHLTSLRSAIVYDVNLRCTCDNIWFLHWARNQQQTAVFMSDLLENPLQCLSEGGLQDLDSYGQAHCWMWGLDVGFVLFVSTSCLLLLFMTVVLLHQLAKDYLQAFYHIAHGWLNEALRRHQNTRGRYLYDAFVSYSGRDERWVMEELLPNLERRGPPFLKLCLHSRDFQLGKDIVENITDSLYRSRRTLCLVSRHYLQSNWCSLEMRLGTYRLQVEHRDVLILVFLEKIPSNLLSAHHRLARLVKTRTYIEWPEDAAQQEAFWERLWKKLLPDSVQ